MGWVPGPRAVQRASTEFPREPKRFHCRLFFWEGIGTCEGGPEEHGSLRDKRRNLLTHSRRRLYSLPLSSFPEWAFPVGVVPGEWISFHMVWEPEPNPTYSGRKDESNDSPTTTTTFLGLGGNKKSLVTCTLSFSLKNFLFHTHVKISVAEGGMSRDNMIQANGTFRLTRPYGWGMEGAPR